ncbi:Nucleotidyl transferase [Saccharicrinis carchari]|uniref:Nucleotidyl transferase n=1 Tax=Saccharicrinis carchari TaxID=1168039 RepID=A0A521B1S2_SACCC|nr:sugar phosphate nucleotidyltransferase [Saccharicrinis carchari]SMO41028.1 Nucleotidyl transferase [Saccharicrinis carchari]
MNALIFAAGLGTRLGNLTQNKPKALVKVAGKTMLLHAIEKLRETGVKHIVINVHHHAQLVKDYVATLRFPNIQLLISDESDQLLETGGGLLKAAPLFSPDHPIIMYNADVLTGANLKQMITYHRKKKGIATLMVKDRDTARYFLFDDDMRLSGWKNVSTQEKQITRKTNGHTNLAFSGIHIVEPDIIPLLGDLRKFSITQGYLKLSTHHAIYGWKDWNEYWFDIGTPEKLQTANKYFH